MGRVNDPLLIGQAASDLSEVPDRDGVNQVVRCSGAVDLNKIRARGVPEATRSLGVHSEGSFGLQEVIERPVKTDRVLHQDYRSAERGWRQGSLFLDVLAHEVARFGGRVATPS